MPVSPRHALILVVPKCVNDPAWDLPVVISDANLLEQSLLRSKYAVRVLGRQNPDECSGTRVLTAIRRACEEVPEAGTLLILFSGHGLHIDGHDYLMPADADLQLPRPERSLVCVAELSAFVEQSRAGQVVLFLDACREGVARGTKGVALAHWGEEKRRLVHKRIYSVVYSCRSGSYSHYVTEGGGFSLFSRALADALSSDNPARTLGEVIEAAQQRLNELSEKHGKPPQKITLFTECDATTDPRLGVICESRGRTGSKSVTDSWEAAIRYSTLWSTFETQPDLAAELAMFVNGAASIAAQAETSHQLATSELGPDPWRDSGYPVRVIRAIEQLTADGCQPALSLPETTLLLSAPFAREHAYAAAVRDLAEARPHELEVDETTLSPTAKATRRRLDMTLRAHPQLVRRWRSIQGDGKSSAAEADCRAILLWLMHRHLARFAAMWHEPPDGTLPPDTALAATPLAATDTAQRVSGTLTRARILKLAKCVRCEVDRLSRTDVPQPLAADVREGPGGEPIRERLLGSLLCLAGWMALDVRVANEVTVDHVGIHDPIEPASLAASAGLARWVPVGRGLQLTLECAHPAIDFTLRDMVAQANQVLVGVAQVLAANSETVEASALMPGQLLPDGISAALENGRPNYTLPHQRFTLAHDEVRELLMGEQLYGNPDLALRELYQNALDACRYRKARMEYLSRMGKGYDWMGKIVFRQGVDRGRPYIECEDNGIGMGVHELESCFARAGRRFADLPEFIEEQEEWLQCTPPIEMTPNSQFGIGVLSYFMIADEISVTTCRLDRKGYPQRRLQVKIPGSGSLFRIQPSETHGDAGTVVRLYLREDWEKSCVNVLKSLLVVAEFDTQAIHGSQEVLWQAGHPRVSGECVATSDPGFWFVNQRSDSKVLADGLVVDMGRTGLLRLREFHSGEDQVIFGAIIDFRDKNRARLTVDRGRMLACNRDWVVSCFEKEARHLLGVPWLRFGWLWNLPNELAKALERPLARAGCELPLGYFDDFVSSYESDFRRRDWFENEVRLTLALPVAVLGINQSDRHALQWLSDLPTHASLDGERGLSSYTLSKFPTQGYGDTELLRRAALLVHLGVRAPDWVVARLPRVRKADTLLGQDLLPPPKRLPLLRQLPPQRLQSIGKKLRQLFDGAVDATPFPLILLLAVLLISLAGYTIVRVLLWLFHPLWIWVKFWVK